MLLNKRIPILYILGTIKMEIVFVAIIGGSAFYLAELFNEEIPEMPITIPAFLGTAISVILSFKLNQSYDRWWESRRVWGSIVNDSRNLILQLQSFVKAGNNDAVRTIGRRHIGWCFCLGQSLRGLNPLDNLNNYLTPEEHRALSEHSNKPLSILQLNSGHIAQLKLDEQLDTFQHVQLNSTIVNLTNSMGMSERIRNTVFPVTYRLFLHLIIYLFVITLSISLTDIQGYFEIPLLLVISSAFFLLEKTATHLQDPFSNTPTDTAVTSIASTIEINILQLLNETDVPEPHKPIDFYLL
jgi:putative membrane protein